jgi:hypothetical protein
VRRQFPNNISRKERVGFGGGGGWIAAPCCVVAAPVCARGGRGVGAGRMSTGGGKGVTGPADGAAGFDFGALGAVGSVRAAGRGRGDSGSIPVAPGASGSTAGML